MKGEDGEDGEGDSGVLATYYTIDGSTPTTSSAKYTAEDEEYIDSNDNGDYDLGELFEDDNGNGKWDERGIKLGALETFTDANGNEVYDDGEFFTDANGNGVYDGSGDGVYLLKFLSQDKAGNIESVKQAADFIRIDKTSPTLGEISTEIGSSFKSEEGDFFDAPIVIISGTASDGEDGSGVKLVEIQIMPQGEPLGDAWLVASGTSDWLYSFIPDVVRPYDMYVRVTDNAKNQTEDNIIVSPPIKLTATPISEGRIQLTWSGQGTYNIYRATSSRFVPDDSSNRVAEEIDVGIWVGIWIDNNPEEDQTNYYKIGKDVDDAKESFEASAIPVESPPTLFATPISGGRIRLTWLEQGTYNIYRASSSEFEPIDPGTEGKEPNRVAYKKDGGVWIDDNTTDQTEYYYKIGSDAQDAALPEAEKASAVADKTSPTIENISATPNSFSPNNDGVDDITTISFTLTEETFVTLRIYPAKEGEGDIPDLDKLKRELAYGVLPGGDNLIEWNGRDDGGYLVDDGTYVYRFEKASTLDSAGNTLLQDISGAITCILAPPLEVRILEARPNPFSPNGDKINDVINLNYTLSDFADYVAVNIFDTSEGSQGKIISSLKTEAFEYYYDGIQWVQIHFKDGIPTGRSDENYYLSPVDAKNPTPPPFGILDRPADAQTVKDYISNYQAINPNWRPVTFTIQWSGQGATGSGAYIYQTAAAQSSGISAVGKTGVILLEGLVVVPDDKTPPTVVRTYPPESTVHSAKLKFVSADLDDAHGTGTDLAASTIRLIGPNGIVPGRQSNDGIDTITWTLSETLAGNGRDDGIYSISVLPVDHSKNRLLNPLIKIFEYNMSVNDRDKPYVDSEYPPVVVLSSGEIKLEKDKEVIVDPRVLGDIEQIQVTVGDEASGIDLAASLINLLDYTGAVVTAEKKESPEERSKGMLLLRNIAALEDGKYTLTVQPFDNAGNSGVIEEYVFKYRTVDDLTPPGILDTTLAFTSEGGTSSPLEAGNFINTPIYSLTIDIKDEADSSGLNLNPEKTIIQLLDSSGKEVKGSVSYENQSVTQNGTFIARIRLTLEKPLSTDGSDDGGYTVKVCVYDNVEEPEELEEKQHSSEDSIDFTYDTIAPPMGDMNPPDKSVLRKLPESISVNLKDNSNGSGINEDEDVLRDGVYLLGPDGYKVPADLDLDSGEGEWEIKVTLIPKTEDPENPFQPPDGSYTMVAIPKDKAGNVGAQASATFLLDTHPPSVISMIPERSSSVNGEVSQGQITFYDENGLDFKNLETKLRMLLFSIIDEIDEFQSDLNENKIPAELRQEFENNGISLSDSATVLIEEEDSRWLITDNHQMYTIRKDEDKLYSYLEIMPAPKAEISDDSLLLQLVVPLSINGVYTIWGEVADQAGNTQKLEEVTQEPLFFIFDDVAPQIEPVLAVTDIGTPELSEGKVINEAINKVRVDVSDLTSGMDFKKTRILLKDEAGKIVPGILNFYDLNKETTNIDKKTTIEINEKATIEWTVNDVSSLKPGIYKVEVEAIDKAQNVAKEEITFGFSPAPQLNPEILSITPKNEERFNTPISQVIVVVKDNSGTGINFEESTITVIKSKYFDLEDLQLKPLDPPQLVLGEPSNNDVDTLFWNFAHPFATDHTDDGEYEVTVEVKDNASNSTETETTFIYDTVPPQVKTGSAYQVFLEPGAILLEEPDTPVNTAIESARVTLDDPSGIDLDVSTIKLNGPVGSVDGKKTDDGIDTLILEFAPLKRDGSDDGKYTISVTPADKVGNVAKFPLEFTFTYDTTPPEVIEVVPAANSIVVSPLNEISVTLDDGEGSGVDFSEEGSSIKLIRLADQQTIGYKQGDDGVDNTITLSFDDTLANGIYHIEVMPQDQLGNSPDSWEIFEFTYEVTAPSLVSTTPEDGAVLNIQIERVTAILQDKSGKGLDFSEPDPISNLTLLNPSGNNVIGKFTHTQDKLVLTLDNLLATDGGDDGEYTIVVTAVDLAGSQAIHEVYFTYDTLAPVVDEIEPTPNAAIKESISEISVKLFDSGAGIDLAKSSISLRGPKGVVSGYQTNDGIATIKWTFNEFADDGTDDGTYTITVVSVDKVGNKAAIPFEYTFIYDTTPPEIIKSDPVANTTVTSPIESISVTLDDGKSGSGLDFSKYEPEVKVSRVINEETEDVVGNQKLEGEDTLIFTFDNPLSVNGIYRVEVTAQDTLGNGTQLPLTFEFEYNINAPDLISTTPAKDSKVNTPINQVTAVLEDRSGEGLDTNPNNSNITLKRGDSYVDGSSTLIENTLIFTLSRLFATDGTDDDKYTIVVTAADLAGTNATYSPVPFIYDTRPPKVSIVNPANGDKLKESVSEVSATLSDSYDESEFYAGIDLAKSSISLRGPKGAVSGHQTDNGENIIKWVFNGLADDGMYTITVTPVDKIGNRAAIPFESTFIYDTTPPKIIASNPVANSTVAFPIDKVSVTLDDGGGSGLDLSASTITVSKVVGDTEQAVVRKDGPINNGVDTLIFTFDKPLSTDGSDNGIYSVEVMPQDKVENTPPIPLTFEFEYNANAPLLIETTPAYGSVLNTPIERVTAVLEDRSGSGLDLLKSNLTLKLGESEVPGSPTRIQDTLIYTLSKPFATNGDDDGEYTIVITSVDLDGSEVTYSVPFIYDTLPPKVDKVEPTPNKSTNSRIFEVSATLSDSDLSGNDGAGIDLSKSSISLKGPNGAVPGRQTEHQTDNGENIIKWEFDEFADGGTDDGTYIITVTPVDKVGNKDAISREYTFIYDTTPPEIIASNPVADSTVAFQIDKVSVTLYDVSGLKLDESTITVSEVEGEAVEGKQLAPHLSVGNGVDTLVFTFDNPLSVNGVYRVYVTPQDALGNIPQNPLTFEFIYNTSAPFLMSTTPAVGSALNTPIEQVTAVLEDRSGRGLDFVKSELTLKRGENELAGNLTRDENTLIFTLEQLFATDGTDDDEYTIVVTSVDLAGSGVTYSGSFTYDTIPPTVSEVEPTPNDAIKESVSQASAKLSDSGAGIDLAKSSISLKGPSGNVLGHQTNNGIDTIKWEFPSLVNGTNTIIVTPVDKVGNKAAVPFEYTFIYDTIPPKITALNPVANSTVASPIGNVSATLDDGDGSGLDLSASTITVSRVLGEAIEGKQNDNGVDTLIFSLDSPLSADGSDNGEYRITVTPKDLLGNTPQTPISFEFTYNASAPLLISTTPVIGSALNTPIERVTAVLQDRSGRELDFEKSNITLKLGEDEVPGSPTRIQDTLIYTLSRPFATDGTDDGDYSIVVTAADLAGSEVIYSGHFIYDTIPPTVSEVEPTPNKAIKESVSEVSATLSEPGADDAHAGIDLARSAISLKGPKGTVSGRQTNDGIDTIKWEFDELADDGRYTIAVTPVDKTGNKTVKPLEFTFIYDTTPPEIIALNPVANTTVASSMGNISATLDDGDGSGLDLSTSTITVSRVLGETLQAIKGEQNDNGVDTLIFSFDSLLSADGSDNGVYRIEVMPKDQLGNSPQTPISFEFTYDANAPLLISTTPPAGSALNSPIEQVTVVLQERSGRELDYAKSSITLKRKATKVQGGIEVPGSPTRDQDTLIYTLSQLFATDGTDDDEYFIVVTATDLSGIEATYSVPFIYDTLSPVVSEVKPTPNDATNQSISQVSAKLSDSGAGIDLFKSSISLKGGSGNVLGHQTNNGIDTIKWEFDELADDGTDDRTYTITVTPVDKVGNQAAIPREFTFIYDTIPPEITALNPVANSTVFSPIDSVSATLDDGDGSGLNLSTSTIRISRVPGGPVEGEQNNNGVDTLTFSFDNPLSTDDSDNGEYRITVLPKDLLGNTPQTSISSEFTYNASAPLLVSSTPADDSVLNTPIERVTAVLQDRSGKGLDFEKSNITLKRKATKVQGEIEIPGSLTHIQNTLIFTLSRLLATDGTDDGIYTISITAVDLAGSEIVHSVSFTYDTLPPVVDEVKPTPNIPTNESISNVSAKLVDARTKIDLENSSISLKGPGGKIPGHQTNDGIDTIKWEFTPLNPLDNLDGEYTIEVTPVDRLGNKAFVPSLFKFIYDTTPPTVSTNPEPDDFLTTQIDSVSAILDDGIGSGANLSASQITVSGPSDILRGTQSNNGIDTIKFRFDSPLATDGSADGDYIIEVIAQDILGNVSEQLQFSFEYRAHVPVLVKITPEDKASFNTSIDVISAVLSDQTDSGLNLAESSITVVGPGVSPEDIPNKNGVDTLFWTFINPLATDGSDDGEYTVAVTAVANSGLSITRDYKFTYDTTAPVVTQITPPEGDILTTSISEVTAILSDAVNPEISIAGVDLGRSNIQLQGPRGNVRGQQANNGVDTIRLTFEPLTADGEYTIKILPRDILGNRTPIGKSFKFKLDTTPPIVVSTDPELRAVIVSPISRVSVTLDDANGAGVDLEKSTVKLTGPSDELVKGSINQGQNLDTTDEVNTIFWNFAEFADNGDDDGEYTIIVMTVDKVGNVTEDELRFGFTYTTKAPGIVSTTPQNGVFINTALNSVSTVLKDNSGEGLDLENTTIALTGPDDQPIVGEIDKGSTEVLATSAKITLTFDNLFAIDGSDDGQYTMTIVAADNAGVDVEYTRKFTYDTIPPSISKASALLEDGEVNNLVVGKTSELNESISEVSAVLLDKGIGADLVGSTIKLTGPRGRISGSQTNDGVSLISFKFQPLAIDGTDDGLYTVTVTPKDLLRNVVATETKFYFLYDTTPPRIVRTIPKDREGIVSPIDAVSVVLDDGSGSGIDFDNSTVSLKGPKGLIKAEPISELDTIILSFEQLPTDIAYAGDYFINITAFDLLGNFKSTVVSFTYEPTAPGIKELSPKDGALLNQPPSEISVTLEPQIGTEISLESKIQLFNPQGALESGELTHNKVDTFYLRFDTFLATDGSDDGKYTINITAMDNRGNSIIHTAEFLYDTTAPEVLLTQPENEAILSENINIISVRLKDEHAGVDLAKSAIILSGVKGKQQNDGVDTIKLQFAQLPGDGVYTITVSPKDVLGNAHPEPFLFNFRLDTTPPTVASDDDGKLVEPRDGAFLVNTRLFQIKAVLDDEGGSGVDLSKSGITLTGPRGEISGEKQIDSNTLIFALDEPLTLSGADDGEYTIEIVAVDKAENSAEPFRSSFVYDTIQPSGPKLENISALPVSFSPNGDGASDTTRISFVLSKKAKITVSVYNSDSELVRTLLDSEEMDEGNNFLIWDGTSDNGDILLDGAYRVKFNTKDFDNLTGALESVHVSIDTQPPIVSDLAVSNNPFTPDGDGFADSTSISFSVTNSTPQDSVKVTVYDARTREIVSPQLPIKPAFAGNGDYSAIWDGSFAEYDGEYAYEVIARDSANNIRTLSGTVALDRNAPSIELIEPVGVDDRLAAVATNQPILLIIIGSAADFSGVRRIEVLVSEAVASLAGPPRWRRVMFSGDGLDNDVDGTVDEEEYNQKDDDGDGKIDEDLQAKVIPKSEIRIPNSVYPYLPVDWIYEFEPKRDGKYTLNIRAMDNVGHTTAESDFITVTVDYDTVSPEHISTTAFRNGEEYAKYKNGNEIKIVSTWDAQGYKVTADFSEIDSQLTGEVPEKGRHKALPLQDNGDGTYTLQHQISLDNEASDGMKTVRITAVDTASNETVVDAIVLELDNVPPEIISISPIKPVYNTVNATSNETSIDDIVLDLNAPPAEPVYKNGDLISFIITCDSANYEISADFSSVDSNAPESVAIPNSGGNTYTVEYQISNANTQPDAKFLPIIISIFDGVNTIVDKSFTVELDNTPPNVISILAKDEILSNGVTAVLTVTLDAPGYTLIADFSKLDSEYTEGAETVTDNGDNTYTVEYAISKESTKEDTKNALIRFKAFDAVGNFKEYGLSVILDNVAPSILRVSIANNAGDEDTTYKNGDVINLLIQTDAVGYELKVDFSFLDSQYELGLEEIIDKGDRTYIVSYTISETNTKGVEETLENLPVIISVSDESHTSTHDAFTLQLDNHPPAIEISRPSEEKPVSTAVQIEITGKTEALSIIKIAPASVESSYDAATGEFSFTLNLMKIGENRITLQATDVAGNKTVKELLIIYRPVVSETISAAIGGKIILPEEADDGIADNDTEIRIPAAALLEDAVVSITFVKDSLPVPNNPEIAQDNTTPLASYRISLKSASGKAFSRLSKPATLILQFSAEREETRLAPFSDANFDIEKLKVFRWDGVRWNKIGGQAQRNNTIIVKVDNISGLFAIFETSEAPQVFKVYPPRPNPFTPNGDGVHDFVTFTFENPQGLESIIRIYDQRGAMVRELTDFGTTSATWDGKDEDGELLELGLYIYQIKVGEKVRGGTVILAR